MCKIDKIKIEEQSNYLKDQYSQLKENMLKMQEDFDQQIKAKQMEVWKSDMI